MQKMPGDCTGSVLVFIKLLSDEHEKTGETDGGHPAYDTGLPVFDLGEMIPYVDTILAEDDKDKDGYISWAEFISRQETR